MHNASLNLGVRWCGALTVVAVMACAEESQQSNGAADASDGSAKTDDARTEELATFHWTHTDGSTSLDFTLTKDCAITTQEWAEAGPPVVSSGVVAGEDCADFVAFVTSSAVLSSIDAKVRCDPSVSEDLTTIRIELRSGAVHERDATGCRVTEPYQTIENDIATLRAKYALASDAGADDGLSAEWCPSVGAACPSGCNAVYGRRYDAIGKCLKPQELIACSHGIDASTISKCRVRTSTGDLYRFDEMAPLEPGYPGWSTCSAVDETVVIDEGLASCP